MKTMAYYFFKWHSRAQVLQAQLFQPLPRTQGTKGQAVMPNRPLLTLQSVSAFLRARPRSRLFCSSETGSFSPHSCKWLTRCKTPPHGGRGGPRRGGRGSAAAPKAFPGSHLPAMGGFSLAPPRKGPDGIQPRAGAPRGSRTHSLPKQRIRRENTILMSAAPA